MGVNFDPKHLAKRMRGMLISTKKQTITIKRPLNKDNLR
jgi:hypothetical protein